MTKVNEEVFCATYTDSRKLGVTVVEPGPGERYRSVVIRYRSEGEDVEMRLGGGIASELAEKLSAASELADPLVHRPTG